MLNKTVYVADGGTQTVREGLIASSQVNNEGYETITVLTASNDDPEKKVFVLAYRHLAFDTKEEAEEKLKEVIAVNEKVKAIRSEAEKQIDSILNAFHGDAPYKHLRG